VQVCASLQPLNFPEGDLPVKVQIAAVVLAILSLATLEASAQSCSSELRQCASRASAPRKCLLAKEQCMKTGRWIGPETGKDYGSRLKQ
jgi:hypothetical protein